MGMSWKDAADWDFVEYSATLAVWNDRQKPPENEFEEAEVHSEPPSLEWMMADDARVNGRGYRVH